MFTTRPLLGTFSKSRKLSNEHPFTKYGILPYFQNKINQWLAPNTHKNIQTTKIQSIALERLRAGDNLLLRSKPHTGKSSSVLLHALQTSLKRIPRVQSMSKHAVDSIIIVPTDEIVEKYHSYTEILVKGMPEKCVPDTITFTEEPNGEAFPPFEVERVPLSVKFMYHNSAPATVSSATGNPQVLVTTLDKLQQIYNNEESRSDLASVKFLAVDNSSLFFKCTDINGVSLIGQRENNGHFYNHLTLLINNLQQLKARTLYKETVSRLELVEHEYHSTHDITNTKNHTKLVMAKDPTLADPGLYKRLSWELDFLNNQEIQFCFTMTPEHVHKSIITMNQNEKLKQEIESLKLNGEFEQVETLEKLLAKRQSRNDTYVGIFSDILNYEYQYQDVYKPRRFKTSGTFLLSSKRLTGYFAMLKGEELIEYEFVHNLPQSHEVRELLELASRKSLKSTTKQYLHKRKPKSISHFNNLIFKIMARLSEINSEPAIIVVPTYIDTQQLVNQLGESYTEYNTASVTKNIVMTVKQFIGVDVQTHNVIIADIDSLIHQTALTSGTPENHEKIPGIEDPYGDLFYSFVWKLLAAQEQPNVIFGLSSKDEESIRQLFSFNNVSSVIEVNRFIE